MSSTYIIKTKELTDQEIKEYHLKKLEQLAISHIGDIPQLDKPTEDQKRWVLFRLRHPNTWHNIRENKIGNRRNWK